LKKDAAEIFTASLIQARRTYLWPACSQELNLKESTAERGLYCISYPVQARRAYLWPALPGTQLEERRRRDLYVISYPSTQGVSLARGPTGTQLEGKHRRERPLLHLLSRHAGRVYLWSALPGNLFM
jgi:hypothetical protein